MDKNRHNCKCKCPYSECEHDWPKTILHSWKNNPNTSSQNNKVCQKCGLTWKEHQEMVFRELEIEALKKYC